MDARPFLGLFLASALAPGAIAQVPPDTAAKIDQVFTAYTGQTPGCALTISDKDRAVYQKGYGLANIEHAVPIDPATTVFDIGSLAKQFTATSVLLLAQGKRLSLDDSIRKHIPELPAYMAPVTLRQLLLHTGGVPDYTPLLWVSGINFEDVAGAEDVLRVTAALPEPYFAPGTRSVYSNTGYFLLGQVVERVSGDKLPDFAQKRIFKPLGMDSTLYLDDYTRLLRHRATSYNPLGKGAYSLNTSNWMMTGDGAVLSTADDLAKWARNFITPSAAVGGRKLVDHLQATGTLGDGTPLTYRNGMTLDTYRGQPVARSFGAWAAFRAALLRFPEQGASIVMLCNVADANVSAMAPEVADAYLGAALAPAAQLDSPRDRSLAGTWVNLDEGVVATIAAKDDVLVYTGSGWNEAKLGTLGDGLYGVGRDGYRQIRFSPATKPAKATLLDSGWNIELVPASSASPSADELRQYVGTFRNAVTGAVWTTSIKDGQLTYHDKRRQPTPLAPLTADVFTHPFGAMVRFRRDASSQVCGFNLVMETMGRLDFPRDGAAVDCVAPKAKAPLASGTP